MIPLLARERGVLMAIMKVFNGARKVVLCDCVVVGRD